jgi:large subunit ribosomal protein L27
MSSKKAGGSSCNGRDSIGRRLGNKVFDGEQVTAGMILVRQRGFAKRPGLNAYTGRDHTIHASIDGIVKFLKKGKVITKCFVSVQPKPTN